MIYPKMLFFCADFPREQGTNCTGGARRRSCRAKRMECVELAPAFDPRHTSDSGSKLHALHTLRAIWFRLCRAEDRRALPPCLRPYINAYLFLAAFRRVGAGDSSFF